MIVWIENNKKLFTPKPWVTLKIFKYAYSVFKINKKSKFDMNE